MTWAEKLHEHYMYRTKHITYDHREDLKGVSVHWRSVDPRTNQPYGSKRMFRRGFDSVVWEAEIPEHTSNITFVENPDD